MAVITEECLGPICRSLVIEILRQFVSPTGGGADIDLEKARGLLGPGCPRAVSWRAGPRAQVRAHGLLSPARGPSNKTNM